MCSSNSLFFLHLLPEDVLVWNICGQLPADALLSLFQTSLFWMHIFANMKIPKKSEGKRLMTLRRFRNFVVSLSIQFPTSNTKIYPIEPWRDATRREKKFFEEKKKALLKYFLEFPFYESDSKIHFHECHFHFGEKQEKIFTEDEIKKKQKICTVCSLKENLKVQGFFQSYPTFEPPIPSFLFHCQRENCGGFRSITEPFITKCSNNFCSTSMTSRACLTCSHATWHYPFCQLKIKERRKSQ